jgi:hypothetical protein
MKGREVFGNLVPFDKVWRTGANSATTLNFSEEVMIGGAKIAAGKYGFLTIPGKDRWTLIISKQTDVTSPADYKQESDVVRIEAKPIALKEKVETFTLQFGNVNATSCDLMLMWEHTLIVLPIMAEIDSKVMKQIDNLMNKDNRPYFNAAMYYMEAGKDLNKALEWFTKATEQNPKAFWIFHQKAKCLAKLGKKTEAIADAEKSKAMAAEAQNGDYVKLNEDLLKTLK